MLVASIVLRGAAFAGLVVAVSGLLASPLVEALLLRPLRAAVAAAVGAALRFAGQAAEASGAYIDLANGSVEIVDSCLGLDVSLFVASAMLVYPSSWRAKGIGVALGTTVLVAVNLARVLMLCWFVGTDSALFESLHEYVWPVVVIGLCIAIQLFWIERFASVAES